MVLLYNRRSICYRARLIFLNNQDEYFLRILFHVFESDQPMQAQMPLNKLKDQEVAPLISMSEKNNNSYHNPFFSSSPFHEGWARICAHLHKSFYPESLFQCHVVFPANDSIAC